MTETVYIYALAAQDGRKPVHCARNMNADVPPPDDMEHSYLSGRESNAMTAQAHELTALLLRGVSVPQRESMGLFIGTCYGSLEDDRLFQASRVADGGKFASPAAFRRTLPSTVPAELTIAFGIRGPLITFADRETPGMLAIIRAAKWIDSGRMNAAIAGSLDFLTPDHADAPDSSSSCRTLLCLLAMRAALPQLQPWATIMRAEIISLGGSTCQAVTPSDETSFSAMAELTAATPHSFRRIEQPCGDGNTCQLELQVM